MAHDAAGGIVPEYALDPTRSVRRPVRDDHHACVLGIADADAAAVMERHPGRPAGAIEQRVEQGPVGYRIRPVLHRLGLAVGTCYRAAVEMVAANNNRSLEFATSH